MSLKTLEELVVWLHDAPSGTQVDASTLAEILAEVADSDPVEEAELRVESPAPVTWAERLWVVPAERRLGVREVLEALGKGRTWLHERMKADHGPDRFPHRKLDGELVFTAGEVRAWVRDQEDVIAGGRMESTPSERGGLNVA